MANQPLFRIPLFERLSDDAPAKPEATPLRRYAQDAALASICTELSHLLNTRRSSTPWQENYSVLDYGIADWSGFKSGFEEDRRKLIKDIRLAISLFEPRLKNPQVELLAMNSQTSALRISAELAGHAGQRAVLCISPIAEGVKIEIEGE